MYKYKAPTHAKNKMVEKHMCIVNTFSYDLIELICECYESFKQPGQVSERSSVMKSIGNELTEVFKIINLISFVSFVIAF